jgi:hypothetical protein
MSDEDGGTRAGNGDGVSTHMTVSVRPLPNEDRAWARDFVRERWGDEIVVAHGVVYRPATLPGLILTDEAVNPVGLLTYVIEADACEIVTIDAMVEGRGSRVEGTGRACWTPCRTLLARPATRASG